MDKNTSSRSLDTKQVQTRCQCILFSFILVLFDLKAGKGGTHGQKVKRGAPSIGAIPNSEFSGIAPLTPLVPLPASGTHP